MRITFDELGAGLLSSGYRKVIFLEVECKIDGTYRLGISPEEAIPDSYECPKCHEARPCSGVIAIGYSRQPLPLQERWCGPGNWNFQATEFQTAA
jgi:hypothetical protein